MQLIFSLILISSLLLNTAPSFAEDVKQETPLQQSVPDNKYDKIVKAANIMQACSNYFDHSFRTRESVARKATCNGYFFGIGGILLSLQVAGRNTGTCLPTDISTEQIVRDYLSWSVENEDKINSPAAESVLTALTSKYPCPQKDGEKISLLP